MKRRSGIDTPFRGPNTMRHFEVAATRHRQSRHRWSQLLRRLRGWTPRIDLRFASAEEFGRAITGPIKPQW